MANKFEPNMLATARANSPADNSTWLTSKKYCYALSLVVLLLPLLSAYFAVTNNQGLWLWLPFIFIYAGITLLDKVFGDDESNPSEAMVEEIKNQAYYKIILFIAVPLLWLSVIVLAYVITHYEWSWFSFLGAALSAGIMAATGVNLGHELGHKVNDNAQQLAAQLALALSGYGHFVIEHNKGHHKDVATPEDPASSRMGESIYKFAQREIPGAFRRARALEAARLQRLGKSPWSVHNEIIQTALITLTAYVLLIAFFGPLMIPFLAIVAAYGYWALSSANYIEHYGLLRQKEASGRYERCKPQHSWNSNHKVSNLFLLHLQRHSDHHAHPTRAYQVLRDYNNVPKLHAGYPWMYILALFPNIWFSIMDPKIADWAQGDMHKVNMDPQAKDDRFRRYHRIAQ
ncbi:alkane 1-monooxygenase [Paraglaciecola hydrolytica]|nr:alkane 1-monooxygenase [Paraglaciecola hydrolytica]